MSVLDTFYILFKTNSAEAVQDVKTLDKQISDLSAKGKKRTEDEEKQLKELRKQRQASTQDIKDQNAEVGKLGESFTSMAESVITAGAAVLSFGTVFNKIFDTARVNSNLQIQGKILNQNTQDILTYGAAVEAAGGTQEAFQSYLSNTTKIAADAGLPLGKVGDYFANIRKQIEGLTPNEKLRRLGQLGITDPGMIALLEQSNEDYQRSIDLANEHARVTQQDTEMARKFSEQWSRVGQSFQTVETSMTSKALPTLIDVANVLQKVSLWVANDGDTVNSFFASLTGVMIALAVATTAAFLPIIAFGAGLAVLGVGVGKILQGVGLFQGKGAPPTPSHGKLTSQAAESMDFWMQNGLTRAQASAMVAQEARESQGDPNAIGDGGQAHGLFQWHSDRQRNIMAGTGIDVRNSSHGDQLKAALWEMKTRGDFDRLLATDSPEEGAAVATRYFERPADIAGESAMRAKIARDYYNASTMQNVAEAQTTIQVADTTPFSSSAPISNPFGQGGDKTVSITTGNITVHTQATDADGIAQSIDGALHQRFADTAANFDDGVER